MIVSKFKSEIYNFKTIIDNELNNFFSETIADNRLNFNKPFLEAIKEFTLRGGKRIRPILILNGFLACGGDKAKTVEVIKASICIELMQSSFLIHDDIMDEADTRRNKPTVHKLLGINQAILAGNIAMVLGQSIILNSNFPADIKLKALQKFNEIVKTTNYGQFLDLILSEKDINDVSEEEINQVMLLKTAKYTIEGPLQLGAIFAGAIDNQLQELYNISIPLGIAFQIQDDILGIFADEKELGKSVYSDVQENKKTLLVWYAYNNSDPDQKLFIKSILGKNDITPNEFEELKKIIIDTGSLDYSKKMAQSLISEANNNINKSSINKEAKDFLLNFADYLIKREK